MSHTVPLGVLLVKGPKLDTFTKHSAVDDKKQKKRSLVYIRVVLKHILDINLHYTSAFKSWPF